MLALRKNKKSCCICGKDASLEYCVTDEHGLSVHQSCHEKQMLLKAASLKIDQWRQAQPKAQAA